MIMDKRVHWIRKHRSRNPMFSDLDKRIVHRFFYDAWAACGRFGILNGTIFRKRVTCKRCLLIMKKGAEK
jgi:hypothetical protein